MRIGGGHRIVLLEAISGALRTHSVIPEGRTMTMCTLTRYTPAHTEVVAAKPTASVDAAWGGWLIGPDFLRASFTKACTAASMNARPRGATSRPRCVHGCGVGDIGDHEIAPFTPSRR